MDIITTHTNADFDALASVVAAKKFYPQAKLVLPGSWERNVRDFMAVCAGAFRFESEKDVSFAGVDRLIVVETRHASRIGKLSELLDKGLEVHLYDHHSRLKGDIKGKLDIYKKCGATVTLFIKLIRKRHLEITPLEATIFALGIYEDTGSLTFPSTTKDDVDCVGYLLSKGADLNLVSTYLHRELSKGELKLLSELIDSTEALHVKGLGIAINAVEGKDYVMDLSLFAHKLMDLENYDVGLTLAGTPRGVQMVVRSKTPRLNAGRLARAFGGGGGVYAASAFVKGMAVTQVKKKLTYYLKRNVKSQLLAKDIMSHLVKVVRSSQKVNDVKIALDKARIAAAAVVDKGKLVGVISVADIDKAIHHGFGHSRVKGYMLTHPLVITQNTPLDKIHSLMADQRLSLLPVVKSGKIVGAVSRAELLKGVSEKGRGASVKAKKKEGVVNLKGLMRKRLPKRIFKRMSLIGRIADEEGYNAFVVGGFVRDLIMGVKDYDLDIVVEKDAVSFSGFVKKAFGGERVVHHRFGTATLIANDGSRIDFATARQEFYERPAALPHVEASSIKQDLFRRDFTINAMAINLNKENFGELLDFFGGLKDIRSKKIRVLHALSFVEDPTRIFRAVRFAERFDFAIEPHTKSLIKTACDLGMIHKTEYQRLREELILILNEDEPLKCVSRMHELHELKFIHPKIRFNEKTVLLFKAIKESHDWFKLSYLKKRDVDIWLVCLMAILDDLSVAGLRVVLKKFVFRKSDEIRLLSIKVQVPKILRRLEADSKIAPHEIYQMLEVLSYEATLFMLAKTKSLRAKKRIELFLTSLSGTKPLIKGGDIERMGFLAGPKFRKILKAVLYAKLDGKLRTKKDELEFVKKIWS